MQHDEPSWSRSLRKSMVAATLPEANIFAPETRPGPQKVKDHLPTIHFQGLC